MVPGATDQICWQSAAALAAALRRRELSAVELIDQVLARCDALEEEINPFALRLDERARTAAEAADALLARGEGGQLCGVPLTIKDSQWLAGYPAAVGSKAQRDFVPDATCAAVERLDVAGAVIFAKTATPEFCYVGVTDSPLCGPTRNPWNLDRVAGGSSGGAAAAVAAGLGPLSLGGDGGGSIRIPAAFCGVVGFKPTFGVVPREPCGMGWKTIVSYGPLSRSVADARTMLAAVAGFDSRDRSSVPFDPAALDVRLASLRGLRLAASADFGHAALDDDARAAFDELLTTLRAEGVEIVEDHPGLTPSIETWTTVAYSDSAVADGHLLREHREELGEAAISVLEFGQSFSAAQVVAAQHRRELIHAAYVQLFARTGAHALLTPALGCEALPQGRLWPERIGDREIELPHVDWAPFMSDANLAGLPACALPLGLGSSGLPLALQLLGPRYSDGHLLAIAEAVESLLSLDLRPPAYMH